MTKLIGTLFIKYIALMEESEILNLFSTELGFELTAGQKQFVRYAYALMNSKKPLCALLLSGYAGTGKTSMVSQFLKTVAYWKYTPVLLAPTGRAAKVFERMSGVPASTIHRYIYKFEDDEGQFRIQIRKNTLKKGIYIIDEVSMIGDDSDHSSGRNLLEDLMEYIFQQPMSKIIFVGDNGQLPPVGVAYSPVLNLDYMRQSFSIPVAQCSLSEVVRQSQKSGILSNATHIRSDATFCLYAQPDFIPLSGYDFPDVLESSYSSYSPDEVLVVCKSNKRAYQYNMAIRNRIFDYDEDLCSSELLMAVKNNYFWLKKNKLKGFIANGESMRVSRITRRFTYADFSFAEADVLLPQVPHPISVVLWLDSLVHPEASLPRNSFLQLLDWVRKDILYEHGKCTALDLSNHPILNAIQVKYAYAVTCHKAQGGQWAEVFVDCGYYSSEAPDAEYRRWLYTAVTRAEKKVFVLGAPVQFFNS